jgi:hypothetical protein
MCPMPFSPFHFVPRAGVPADWPSLVDSRMDQNEISDWFRYTPLLSNYGDTNKFDSLFMLLDAGGCAVPGGQYPAYQAGILFV